MVDKTPLKASKLTPDLCKSNLEHSFGQISVILLCDLCFIGGSVKDRGVVVDIIDVNHHCCVVFIQIVWSHQSQFILGKSLDDREVDTKDNDVFSLMMGANNVEEYGSMSRGQTGFSLLAGNQKLFGWLVGTPDILQWAQMHLPPQSQVTCYFYVISSLDFWGNEANNNRLSS